MSRSPAPVRSAAAGERFGHLLVALVMVYVPLVAVSLDQIRVALPVMAGLYGAPLAVALVLGVTGLVRGGGRAHG